MTILDIIKELERQGHEIKYYHRKDGGYVITKMDGQHFSGKTGNAFARRMVGADISVARKVQLQMIRTPKGKKPKKLSPLPENVKKALRKVQKAHKKQHPTIQGTVSTRGVRYRLEHYGEEETLLSLDKAYRYTQGYAYIDNVLHLLERINLDLSKEDSPEMEEVARLIEEKMLDFKEEWISKVYECLYEWEKGTISDQECAYRIKAIIS